MTHNPKRNSLFQHWTKPMKYLLSLILPLLFAFQVEDDIEKLKDGLLIHLHSNETRFLKIQVISADIIHVTAFPNDSATEQSSLIVEHNSESFQDWTYSETDNIITISTKKLTAEITLKTGAIVFKDSLGMVILKEKKEGGKSYVPETIDNKVSYSIKQVFDSPDDEAFYGLGQHQNRQMNYKGEDVELAQHNLVAVVPFLYSSKNYGILWDNYSISRFGDPRELQPISGLNLYRKDGQPGGLTAEYYYKDKLVLSRTEDTIDFQYLESMHRWPDALPMLDAKVIWEGSFSSDLPGTHKFALYASEYFKLWIDGKLIFDKWRQNWNPWYNKFTVDMNKGEKHSIRLEWIPNEGYLALLHLDPLKQEEQNNLSLFSEVANSINYYFIYGDNADDVISGYRKLTGKAPIMPEWALGFWQSRERYKTQDELIGVVKEFRKRNIPLDNIILDWFYWKEDQWGSHEFDPKRFPDPDGMIDELHKKLHTQIMISVWPKFYRGTDNFDEMQKRGFLFQRNLELNRKDWVGYVSTFYNPFIPEAGKLFWNQINSRLNSKGIDGWWLDATEPDMQSNHTITERKTMMNPAYSGSGAQYFNAFSLLNSKAVYEGSRNVNPDKRVFILTRSAFAGQQRYAAATWSGDVACRWSDLGDQISAGLNFSISGIPYWTHDIGGFSLEKRYENPKGQDLDEWRELNTRWFQFGSFCPIFRVHGQYPYREMFNIAPENHPAFKSMLYYDKLRHRLIPYIYTLAGLTYHNDYTIMRPLIMDFPEDKLVRNINDQYMFGPSILVCPVHDYKARSREVYLPSGCGWYDFYTGAYFKGGQKLAVEAPLEKIPLFIKEGSILPIGPEIQYIGEKSYDTLKLYLYAGRDADFCLYEDEGINYNYEKGSFSNINVNYLDQTKNFTIQTREGDYPGMLKKRVFVVIYIDENNPVGIDQKYSEKNTLNYDGTKISILLN